MKERTRIDVRMDGKEYVAVWDGREVRSTGAFMLDNRLDAIGAPIPRDLYLIEIGVDE